MARNEWTEKYAEYVGFTTGIGEQIPERSVALDELQRAAHLTEALTWFNAWRDAELKTFGRWARIPRKNYVVTFRLTKEQRDALRRVAKQQGSDPSALIRDLILREIGRWARARIKELGGGDV